MNRAGLATRERLLSAGLTEIHERGFNDTGVDAIAKAADTPKGSFYNFFKSKEAFGAEIIDLYYRRHQEKLQEFFDDRSRTPLERLRAYFDEMTKYFAKLGFRRGCMMGNLSLEIADQREEMRLKLRDNFRNWSTIFSEAIAQAQAAGEVTVKTEAKVLAEFILNSWEGALLRMKSERSLKPLTDAKKIIFENILN